MYIKCVKMAVQLEAVRAPKFVTFWVILDDSTAGRRDSFRLCTNERYRVVCVMQIWWKREIVNVR